MKIKKLFAPVVILSLLFASSCKKDDDNNNDNEKTATVTTTAITQITATTAKSGGNVTQEGNSSVSERGVVWSTSQNPTFDSNNGKTNSGTGAGSFEVNITGLNANTQYFVRAYATNNDGTSYGASVSFTTLESGQQGGVADGDGNTYPTVVIGQQEWFGKNLKTTKYNDGSSIPNVTDNTQWGNLTTDAYAWYENNSANANTNGALYNIYAVNTGKLCPAGWHVPSKAEWETLTTYLTSQGYSSTEGTVIKSTTGWIAGNGTDNFEFTGVPAGYRDFLGSFAGSGANASWWSTTSLAAGFHSYAGLLAQSNGIVVSNSIDAAGLSVRCLKD